MNRRSNMSRRLATSITAIAVIISAIALWFSVSGDSTLWIIISAIVLVASFIGYFLCNRCPHCGRIINLTLFRSTIYCRYCGQPVDLDEKI